MDGIEVVLSHRTSLSIRFSKVDSRTDPYCHIGNDKGYVDGFVRDSTFAKRLYEHLMCNKSGGVG